MSQNNSNAKTAMLAKLDSIHKVEGFDPSPFAVDYTDLNTQETRKRRHPGIARQGLFCGNGAHLSQLQGPG